MFLAANGTPDPKTNKTIAPATNTLAPKTTKVVNAPSNTSVIPGGGGVLDTVQRGLDMYNQQRLESLNYTRAQQNLPPLTINDLNTQGQSLNNISPVVWAIGLGAGALLLFTLFSGGGDD